MAYNLHPYNRAHDTTNYNYMSLDMNTLNPYNYKDLTNKLIPYQKQQDMYYFTRQLNPISMVHLGAQWMDPSNIPSNNRQTIYESVNLNNQERLNQYQTPQNNSNLWRDNYLQKLDTIHRTKNYPRVFLVKYQIYKLGKLHHFKNFMGCNYIDYRVL